jgi:effector-binding domain-containing protein
MKILLAWLFPVSGAFQILSFPLESTFDLASDKNINYKLSDTIRKPLISVEKINLKPMKLLVIPDIATELEDFGQLMNRDYGELFTFINNNHLQPGKVIAFYYTAEEPFTMDVAVEVNKLPHVLTGRIKAIELEGGVAVVVHYQGPYEQIGAAYDELKNWMKQNNKKAMEMPFESYLNNPAAVKDLWELRTDIYQRIE